MAPIATESPLASHRKHPDFQKTAGDDVGFGVAEDTTSFKDKHAERDYIKGRLAGAYRIFGHYGLNEGLAGHITARDPIDPETFWVNPLGVDFNIINKSDLLRVDHKGNVLDHGPKSKLLNKAAFLIHGAIHAARPDVICAAHTHSVHGRAYCSLGKPLEMISLESCLFFEDQVLFEGKGVVLAEDEGCDIADALGEKKAALLRNHGLLTVGQSIEEAVFWFYTLDKCCHVQLLADAAADGRGGATVKITDEEAEYTKGIVGTHKGGWFGGKALFDLIDEVTGKKYWQ
ncbi:hypothetical protein M409DRAFT_23948 [Zasmidium cellare ATCC 36951]|uniref:Class II aldolase/adducin N-terminal domain-containing protein n=1 Tax=Zasmidium cellare ATCC 36951 TaxID=1080233 RepID=A0A6A6CHI5_ZASCE|nr:uncharacterized protein M409DRAFT_23948 [Zasmidium cellare ATCC 36951]KAF2165658.1 hypothetical protein M409DRAFT_23948 [Zasmidium cellare ATCC 36951]